MKDCDQCKWWARPDTAPTGGFCLNRRSARRTYGYYAEYALAADVKTANACLFEENEKPDESN